MKTVVVLFALVVAFFLGGCAEAPLMSDEEYDARHGPAPNQPNYSSVLPAPSNRPPGHY